METCKYRWKGFLRDLLLTWFYISSSSVIARNIERYDTAYECEGKTLRIECREGELIHLIRANYGRFSITICNEHGNTDWSVNCMSPKSFRVLYNKCNQQQNCSIVASTSQFGDPCPNTLKYLEAHYQCVSATTTTTTSRPSPPWLLTSQPPMWSTGSLGSTISTTRSPSKITTSTTVDTLLDSTIISFTTSPVDSSSTKRTSSTKIHADEESKKNQTSETEKLEAEDAISPSKPAQPAVLDETTPISSLSVQPQPPFTSTSMPWKTSRRTPTANVTGPACPAQDARKLKWNATRLGEMAVQSCPGGANGLARWQCVQLGDEATWQRGTPDLSECRSVWLSSLEKRVQEGEVILGISSDLSKVTNNSPELYGGDMLITTKILKNMADKMAEDTLEYPDLKQREVNVAELLQGAVTTGSNLLDKAQSDSWKDLSHQEQMIVATSLLIGLEENAFLLADTLNYEKNVVHERRNILMEVRVLAARNLKNELEVFPNEPGQQDRWAKLHDRVELTRGALLGNENKDGFIRLVFMAFDRLEEILQPQTDSSSLTINEEREQQSSFPSTSAKFLHETNVTRKLNSKVISASLGKGKHVQLSEPVRLYFQHLIRENVTNPRCVFWDYTTSGWSEEGCITRKSNKTHTICECNHLTNFAVLMDVHAVKLPEGHQKALQIITYIGCMISVVCLVLAIITFQLFRGLKSDRTTIHKNLCVCLLIAEVLFMCGIGQTNSKIVCGIVAGLLHFFFLCAFAWMFLEGFQLYVMLIEVFEAEKSRLRWYYLVAYGAPLLVVAISCVIDPLSYGTSRYCWLRADNYFIFSFVGPVILVILANLVFLSMAIYMMCRHANTTVSMKSKEHSRLASASGKEENALPNKLQAHLAWLRGAIVLVFLLGLTWTFGLLYLNEQSVVMAYIFTVLNSLQGLFIFAFHCVQNEKVRKEYRKFIRRNSWLPKCLRCSKSSSPGTSGISAAGTGVNGGKDFASHNTSSNPSAPTTDSSGLSPHGNTNNISFKSHSRDSGHGGSEQGDSPRILAFGGYGHGLHGAMTLQGYSLRARERRLLGELEVGSRATTGRRAASPYNHTYTEIREARQQQQQQQQFQHHLQQQMPQPPQQQPQDDPVYEEIERSAGVLGGYPEAAQTSDMSDEDGRRQSDMSRQSSRSYGDHRPLIPYSPAAERGLEAAWTLERLRRQQQQQQQHQQQHQQQCRQMEVGEPRPQDHTRTVAVLDGHTVVCHLQPQADLYAAHGLAPPSYSEC